MNRSFVPLTDAAQRELVQIARLWTTAATPLKPGEIAALYTQDAVFFGGLPEHYVGREQVETYFNFYKDILASIELSFSDGVASCTDSMLLYQGFADFRFGLVDGRTTFNRLRATLILERVSDTWQIKLHHFSPPPSEPPVPR